MGCIPHGHGRGTDWCERPNRRIGANGCVWPYGSFGTNGGNSFSKLLVRNASSAGNQRTAGSRIACGSVGKLEWSAMMFFSCSASRERKRPEEAGKRPENARMRPEYGAKL